MRIACTHARHMPRMIQIRNVPDALHRKLEVRPADAGQTLSAYLLAELERLAARPTREEMLARIHGRRRVTVRTPAAPVIRETCESAWSSSTHRPFWSSSSRPARGPGRGTPLSRQRRASCAASGGRGGDPGPAAPGRAILCGEARAFDCGWRPPAALRVEGGARQRPDLEHPRDRVSLVRGGRSLLAHRFDLHQPKGRPASRWRSFSSSGSFSVARSATTRASRRVSSSSAATSRVQVRLAARAKRIRPLGDPRCRHAMATPERLEIGAPETLHVGTRVPPCEVQREAEARQATSGRRAHQR